MRHQQTFRANRHGRTLTAAATALLLICAPLAAQARAANAAAPTDAGLAGAAGQAEQLRLGLAGDTVAFAKSLAPVEQVALVDAVGPLDARSAVDVGWFFRTATATEAGDVAMPIVTFYNPLADAALVTTWRRIDAHWWMTAVFRLNGPTLRGKPDKPWWAEGGGLYSKSLVRQADQTLRQASGLTDARLKTVPEATRQAFAMRLFMGERGLATWAASDARVNAYATARAAIVEAKPEGLGLKAGATPPASTLAALDEDVRRSLVAVSAFRRADGITLALASPMKPGLLIFIDFDGADAPKVLDITAVDLTAPATTGGRA